MLNPFNAGRVASGMFNRKSPSIVQPASSISWTECVRAEPGFRKEGPSNVQEMLLALADGVEEAQRSFLDTDRAV